MPKYIKEIQIEDYELDNDTRQYHLLFKCHNCYFICDDWPNIFPHDTKCDKCGAWGRISEQEYDKCTKKVMY